MLNWYKALKLKSYSAVDRLAVIASIKHSEPQANTSHDKGLPKSTNYSWIGWKMNRRFLIL